MKKYLKGLIITLVAVIALVPFISAKAADAVEINEASFDTAYANRPTITNGISSSSDGTIFTLHEGSYKLTGDIEKANLVFDGNVVIDLNGHTLTFDTYGLDEDDNVTFNGNGTVNGVMTADSNAKLIINGGNFNGDITVRGETDLVITDGTFTNDMGGAIHVETFGNVTISGGKFTGGAGASAMYIMEEANVTISGGEFTSQGDNGVEVETGVLNISGGVFKGAVAGLMLGEPTLNLSGGKFISTNNGGITTYIRTATNDTFNSWLLDGYEYSPAVSVSTNDYYAFSQKEIEVKKIATEEVEEPKTNNPNTSDNIMIYISLLGLSLIGLTGLKLSKKGLI